MSQLPGTSEPEDWHDAGLSVYLAHERLIAASDPLSFASDLLALNEAMSDLATFLPGYDYDLGRIPDEED